MTDRVPSDHDAVASHRVEVTTVGRTSRPRIVLPSDVAVEAGDVVRLSLEGTDAFALVERDHAGELTLDGAFGNARQARTPGDGENRLAAWTDEHDLAPGDALVLDVVTPGYQFGLRRPGERVVYAARDPPDSSLSDIARQVEE